MRYEIDYLSRSENTKKLADAVEKLFPVRDTEIIDLLHEEPTADADVYVIIFSFNKGTVPLKIMDMLDLLEGKTILFLVTLETNVTSDYQEKKKKKITLFLPADCDYRGVFLCKGAFPESVIAAAEKQLKADPDNEYAHMVSECCHQAKGHPDRIDMENACEFVRSQLQL